LKEITQQNQDEVRNLNPEQKAKVAKVVFQKKPKPGQKVFEFDVLANTIKEAEFSKPSVVSFEKARKGDLAVKKRIDIKKGCLYECALNATNAIKRFKKKYPNMKTPEIIKTSHNEKK